MVFRVGITGGMGSGKSTVAKLFAVLGIPVYDADAAAKRIMNEDETLKSAIVQHFGKQAYLNGNLNRSFLSEQVFADKEKLNLLNQLTHPATINDANEWMKEQDAPYALKEAALIFEGGAAGNLDFIIGVSAPAELRIQRSMHRDGASRENVLTRMKNQIPDSIKMKLCDYVILNDEREHLIPQVLKLNQLLISLAKNSKLEKA